jgi:acyl-CoA synthetase (AMP-forming)/AMP-acid ligase II
VLTVLPAEELPDLQTIIVAGEACSADIVARWASGRRFFNAYGPTEATVCATIAECSDAQNQPPIGRAIANTQVYILDRHLQPVPIGIPGELYIGGLGLARGYLNLPELTEEKFIPNPFGKAKGAGEQGSRGDGGDGGDGGVIFNISHSALSTQHSALSTQHSALSTQHSAPSTQHSALSTQHSALSTQHSALSTQHSALSTHRSVYIKLATWLVIYQTVILSFLVALTIK